MIRKTLSMLVCLSVSWPCQAMPCHRQLNEVTLQFSAESWVKTATPLVVVHINATVTDHDLGVIQGDLLERLQKIASAEWHLTDFNRTEDASGLEKIEASAEVRLAQGQLSGLRERLKSVSRPGLSFVLGSVSYTPTTPELRIAQDALRSDIYAQISAEMQRLAKFYPKQNYYLHRLSFVPAEIPQPLMAAQNTMVRVMSKQQASIMMPVSNRQLLNATVVLASDQPDVTGETGGEIDHKQ